MSQTTMNGYRKRPWELTVLAAVFALVPLISVLTWYAPFVLAGRPESLLDVLAHYFGTVQNGPVGLGHSLVLAFLWIQFLVVAWGVFRVTPWGFYLCIVSAAGNSLFSMVEYSVGRGDAGVVEYLGFNPFAVGVLANLVFFIPVLVLLRKKIMTPFFNPRLKWWEQHPRVRASLRVEATVEGRTEAFQSFDISASGMFLGTQGLPNLPLGGQFPAVIRLGDQGEEVRVSCLMVWISDGTGRAPMGCGVTFTYADRRQKKLLARYIAGKIQEGHLLERK